MAMSGGVDSSAAALMLKEQGREVVGVTMLLHDGYDPDAYNKMRTLSEDESKNVYVFKYGKEGTVCIEYLEGFHIWMINLYLGTLTEGDAV